MRQLLMVALVASLASLPACAVREAESTPPTVTYAFNDDDDYDEVAERAELYCAEQYGANAVLLERDVEGDGYEATFSCE